MARDWISVRGLDAWVDAVQNASSRSERELEAAVEDVGKILRRAVGKRVWPVKRLNIQDTNRPRSLNGRKPITLRTIGSQGEVELRSYWANPRAEPVENVLQATGNGSLMIREALQVDPRGASSGGARFRISFSEAPRLETWAKTHGQYLRHAVRIPVAALADLAMGPAVEASREQIEARFDQVADKFVKEATQ